MITNIYKLLLITLCSAAIFTGCVTTKDTATPDDTKELLRIGVSPNYPPIIYKQNKKIIGIEADLAKALAITLDRKLEFVEIKWQNLIPALNSGKIDIIMSGMSITMPRSMQISFTEPYLRNGLMTAVPTEKISLFRTPADILLYNGKVGVVKNTIAEEFVRRFMVNSEIVLLKKPADVPHYLNAKRISMFIDDAYSIGWLISQNENKLAGIWTPLSNDYIAAGISRGNPKLLKSVNDILKKWKSKGALDKMLDTWLPLRNNIQWNDLKTNKTARTKILGYE